MTAPEELVVFRRVTLRAILRRQRSGNHKAAVLQRRLAFLRRMTLQAIDALRGVDARFVLMDDRRRLRAVAFRAFPGRADEFRRGIGHFVFRALGVEQKRRDDERAADDDSDKYGTKFHECETSYL